MMDKMRIIYTPDSAPVAEYIKTFFDFVGLLVYDKLIISDADIRSINKPSGSNSIDIVINMYGLPVYPKLGLNQVYLYVDLEQKAFMLGDKPLKSIKDLKRMIYEKSDKVTFFGSKRDTRIKILDSLIEKISGNNSESLRILKEIRELYVPTNEDKDMFYVLQTVNMIDMVFNSKILTGGIPLPRNTGSFDASFAINELTKMYVDLSRIKDNLFNPYLKSSIVSVLESLSAYAGSESIDKPAEYLTRKTVFFEEKLGLSAEYVEEKIHNIFKGLKARRFVGKFLFRYFNEEELSRFELIQGFYTTVFYKDILKRYASFFLSGDDKGAICDDDVAKIREIAKIIFENDPYDLETNCILEYFLWNTGKFREFMSNFERLIIIFFQTLESGRYNFSSCYLIEMIKYLLQCMQISWGNNLEYAARNAFNLAVQCLFEITDANYVRRIADEDENSKNNFLRGYAQSQVLNILYPIFEEYCRFVQIDEIKKREIVSKTKELT